MSIPSTVPEIRRILERHGHKGAQHVVPSN